MGFFLGIDSGLTVTKAVVFDGRGNTVATAHRSVRPLHPRPHHVERSMDDLWMQTSSAIREALDLSGISPHDVSAVSQTAHGDGLYLLDRQRRPLRNGILSLDSRAASQVGEWCANAIGKALLERSGQLPHASAPAAILAWLKINDPATYSKIGHVLSCKDWLRFCLTGEVATDATEASTSFCNVESQCYDPQLLEMFGIPEIWDALPPVLHSAELAGHVCRQASEKTGLVAGTPVATGLHDVTASSLGMGGYNTDTIAVVAGTYCINEIVSEHPTKDERWFCRNAIAPGQWNNMAISPASSTNYEWFVNSFCSADIALAKDAGTNIHDILAAEATQAGTTSALFHPFLFGSPFGSEASAAFAGLRGWHNRGDIVLALLEGIVLNHKHHIDDLSSVFSAERIVIGGGVTRNPLVPQLFADAVGRSVDVSGADEAAALGAAICAGVASGHFANLREAVQTFCPRARTINPSAEGQARMSHKYDLYVETLDRIKPLWPRLNKGVTS